MCKRLCPLLVCSSLLPCLCSWLWPWLWPLLLPLPFAITLAPVLALAFALAFTGDVFDAHRTSHRVWRLCVGFVSAVSQCPCLVRAQEGLESDTQLVVFTFELLIVHQQIVFVFRRCVPDHLTSTSLLVSRTPNLAFPRLPQIFELCRVISHPWLQHSLQHRESSVSKIRTRSCLALVAPVTNFVLWSLSPTRRTERGSRFEWSRMTRRSRLECSLWAVDSASRKSECYASLIHESEMVLQLESKLMPFSLFVVKWNRPRCQPQHL